MGTFAGTGNAAGATAVDSEGVSPDTGDVTMEEEHNPLALQIVPQPEEDAVEPEIPDTYVCLMVQLCVKHISHYQIS